MDADRIIQHLVDISKGECSITEESILKLDNAEDQSVELGLLTLFEEIEFNRRQLEDSNKEKDLLLKEIHHRVKNNLQIVRSLLSLQKMFVKDEHSVSLLEDCAMRVNSMSIIHQRLYQSKNLGTVNYKEYLEELIGQLSDIYVKTSDDTKLDIEIPEFCLSIDIGIPLGLLINEILTNSFKYGTSEKGKNEVYLKINFQSEREFELLMGDNGPGYSDELFNSTDHSLGVQLIHDLAEQVGASVVKEPQEEKLGTHYRLNFTTE